MALKETLSNQEGQAFTEYILLVAVLVGIYMVVTTGLAKIGLTEKLTAALTGPFSATYQYGHPLAAGFDKGGPKYHPRVIGGENNFRLFLNPKF